MHLLGGPVDVDALTAAMAARPAPAPRGDRPDLAAELVELRARVDRIERELGLDLPS
jgi:hypothetical protein